MNKNIKTLRNLAAMVIAALALTACSVGGFRGNGDDNFFSAFRTFSDTRWDYNEPVVFAVDTLRDSIARGGTMIVCLRHTHGYEYSNIWLELSTPDTDSTRRIDTLNIILADNFGHWLGKGTGPSLQVSDTIGTGFNLRMTDSIIIRHIMRVDTVAGVEQVGLVFLPND